jgi:ubiquinone/menaquinone biosynthesis C-methylase UbiE
MSVQRLKSTWERLGRVDPLWAVLAEPEMRNGKWDVADFMRTGEREVGWVLELLADHGLTLGERVLDYGCGVGRLSNALTERVPQVVGVDIAESMIEQARQLNRHPSRLTFLSYDGHALPFEDDTFDGAVSLIVLQHVRPLSQVAALLELQRAVRPGGVIVVQIPSHVRLAVPLPPESQQASIDVLDAPKSMVASEVAPIRARVTNRSSMEWPTNSQIKLANHWLCADRLIAFDDGRAELHDAIAPGAYVELQLHITAPPTEGLYQVELDMLQEFVGWWKDAGNLTVRIDMPVVSSSAVPLEPASGELQAGSAGGDLALAMEMHGMHVTLAEALFKHCGSEVIAAVPDSLAGPEWDSFTYLVRSGS